MPKLKFLTKKEKKLKVEKPAKAKILKSLPYCCYIFLLTAVMS